MKSTDEIMARYQEVSRILAEREGVQDQRNTDIQDGWVRALAWVLEQQ